MLGRTSYCTYEFSASRFVRFLLSPFTLDLLLSVTGYTLLLGPLTISDSAPLAP